VKIVAVPINSHGCDVNELQAKRNKISKNRGFGISDLFGKIF
jgi:hypothetical protein